MSKPLMSKSLMFAVLVLLSLSACKPKEEPPRADEPKGREETRLIRNTEAIGYAGDAIADKVDSAIDAVENSKQRIDEAEEAQTGGQ